MQRREPRADTLNTHGMASLTPAVTSSNPLHPHRETWRGQPKGLAGGSESPSHGGFGTGSYVSTEAG